MVCRNYVLEVSEKSMLLKIYVHYYYSTLALRSGKGNDIHGAWCQDEMRGTPIVCYAHCLRLNRQAARAFLPLRI